MSIITPSIVILPTETPFGLTELSQVVDRGDFAIVWADLHLTIEQYDWNTMDLSDEENRRAEGYIQEEDRQRFVQRRRILRRLLGGIFCREPQDVVIRTDSTGKPFVDPVSVPWPVSFSLSHSRDRVIFAFVRNRPIGIDIEYRDPSVEVMKMAGVICTEAERQQLETLAGLERVWAFYDCWCAKEAFIKAAGVREPTSFEVLFWPWEPGLIQVKDNKEHRRQWSFHRMETGGDWSAMLVTEGRLGPINVYQNPTAEFVSRYCKSPFALLRDSIV